MIATAQEYRITKNALRKLRLALDDLVLRQGEDPGVLARAEREALKSEIEILVNQIQDYESEYPETWRKSR